MKRLIFLSLIFFCFFSCRKKEFNIANLNGNRIIALGHGGMGISSLYPINSYESISKCLNLGMDGTEIDVQMTKDSVLVACHDEELTGRTNKNGYINSFNWAELKNVHFKQTLFLNYPITSLENIFSNIKDLQKFKFTFDCKLYTENKDTIAFIKAYINAVTKTLKKYQLENNVCIESPELKFLRLFKNKEPGYKLFVYPQTFEEGFNEALSLGLFGITISTQKINKEQIKLAHDNNLSVAIWNIRSESENVDGINKNPDYIQTDRVKSLIKLLK